VSFKHGRRIRCRTTRSRWSFVEAGKIRNWSALTPRRGGASSASSKTWALIAAFVASKHLAGESRRYVRGERLSKGSRPTHRAPSPGGEGWGEGGREIRLACNRPHPN
jgi:hypothetical protein